tara:strand:- start:367 stop:777 length:411 start_codon:yes stop_codon:yes gene_type:complete
MSDRIFLLRDFPLFKDLNWKMISLIEKYIDQVFYGETEEIYRKGEISSSIGIIAYGEIELKDEGRTLQTLGKGDSIISGTGLTPVANESSAIAKVDSMVLKIEQDILFNIMSKNSDITKIVIRNAVHLVENSHVHL